MRLAAALLLSASVAFAQEETRRRLVAPENIDGVSCASTKRAYAEFHPSGRLKSCPVANDTTIAGHQLFSGTWVTLDDTGKLRGAWLIRDTELAGHRCKGTGYKGYAVRFHADESLELCYLARDTVIAGVPCLHGSFWTEMRGGGKSVAHFGPDGALLRCQLSGEYRAGGTTYRRWDVVAP